MVPLAAAAKLKPAFAAGCCSGAPTTGVLNPPNGAELVAAANGAPNAPGWAVVAPKAGVAAPNAAAGTPGVANTPACCEPGGLVGVVKPGGAAAAKGDATPAPGVPNAPPDVALCPLPNAPDFPAAPPKPNPCPPTAAPGSGLDAPKLNVEFVAAVVALG